MLINIALNLIFVPLYGIYASAWATVVSTVLLSIGYIVYIRKYDIVKIPVLTLLKLALVFLVFLSVYYGLTLTSLHWLITTSLAGLLLLGISWLLGLLHFKEPPIES